MQKHQAFEAEINANRSRLDAVDATGQQLISEDHYASELIQQRLDELHDLWRYLFECSGSKGMFQPPFTMKTNLSTVKMYFQKIFQNCNFTV